MRDSVHNFPKLNLARRNLRRCRRALHFPLGILVEDESRSETAGPKDSRSGDGSAAVNFESLRSSTSKQSKLNQKTTHLL